MTPRDNAEQALTTAKDAVALATAEAARAEHIAELLAQPGLTYGDLGDGTQYVALDGEHIGDCRRRGEGTSPLLSWWAYPADGEPATGPYLTARQGAAALMRLHDDTTQSSQIDQPQSPPAASVGD
jgi:hypothetical protein